MGTTARRLSPALIALTLLTAACARSPRATAPQVDDSRGGQLACRQGSTTMQIEVPPGRLAEIRGLAARMGYSASDCVFTPTR